MGEILGLDDGGAHGATTPTFGYALLSATPTSLSSVTMVIHGRRKV